MEKIPVFNQDGRMIGFKIDGRIVLNQYCSVCPKYYGSDLGTRKSLVMSGFFTGDDVYHLNNRLMDELLICFDDGVFNWLKKC